MTAETECGYEQQEQAEYEALRSRVAENLTRLDAVAPKPERPAPPYRVERLETRTPGTGRYRITKADGTVYYVTYGSVAMSCTCPDSRHRRPGRCKHCVFVANLIGRPELAKEF